MTAVTAAVPAIAAVPAVARLTIDGLAAHQSHLATLRHQLAEAQAAEPAPGELARVQELTRNKLAAEERIESLRRESSRARDVVVASAAEADADADADAEMALGRHVDEFV